MERMENTEKLRVHEPEDNPFSRNRPFFDEKANIHIDTRQATEGEVSSGYHEMSLRPPGVSFLREYEMNGPPSQYRIVLYLERMKRRFTWLALVQEARRSREPTYMFSRSASVKLMKGYRISTTGLV
jgi:hypothetical protein